ncbi:MAG: class I SAM-dependent methyltransferase [Victivallaceae bacterium]|nr:class I SAM-dependent methyltransferase [Victivallaceae bacterium]
MTHPEIVLAPGREKSLLRRHPWVFSGAIAFVSNGVRTGEVCRVLSADGKFLAWASFSPKSQIAARAWSFDETESIDAAFFRERIAAGAALREKLGLAGADSGCRLIFSESDGLPGVVADRYGKFVALQILSAGAEFFRTEIVDALMRLPGIEGVYERSDVSIRRYENLPSRSGVAAGATPPDEIVIRENGMLFSVDPVHGQKTGFYFDLRDVRRKVKELAAGKRVLNVFCYTGGFAVAALAGGAESLLNVDSSRPALQRARRNLELNAFQDKPCELRAADAFGELDRLRDAGEKFDLVILDPPKLVDSKSHLLRGCRAYSMLARRGFELLSDGGILLNLSCSGLMTAELFQKITADAALEAGCAASIVGAVRQSADHPVALAVPETFYLKGLISVKRGSNTAMPDRLR